MIPAPPTPDEARRTETLRNYAVLDTPPEQALDDLTTLAAQICGAPVAMISLIDANRQWYKSKVGTALTQTPRDVSFCGHAIHQRDIFIVPDANLDERFVDSPLVTGDPYIRFYAGAPLVTADDTALGTLCVIDHMPRTLTEAQQQALRVLARQVMTHLELRHYTRELVESEERLRVVTNNARVGLVIVNRDRRYTYANKAYAELLGLPSSDIVGQRVADVLAPIYEEQLRPRLDRAFAGERVSYELCKPRADGEGRYEIRYEPTTVNRAVPLVVVVVTDMTERKRAEDVLRDVSSRESGHHQKRIFRDLAVIAVLCVIVFTIGHVYDIFDPIVNYIAVKNNQLNSDLDEVMATVVFFCLAMLVFSYRRWRESRAEALSQTQISKALGLLHKEMETQVRQRTEELTRSNEDLRQEAAERRRAEATIKQFPAIIESSDDAIISKTLDGIVTSWNPAAERMFGYAAPEIIGKPITVLFPPDRIPEEKDILARIARGEHVQHFETVRVRKDGRHLDVSATISPIKDAAGKITGVSKIVRDITERKEVQEQLLWKTAFFEAQANSALDGILIVDSQGKTILQNQQMVDLWKFPREIARQTDDRVRLEWVTSQIKDPRKFTEKVTYLYAHPEEISRDEIELVDGRIFDRYSAPVRGQDGKYYGRIWSFRDITERKRAEETRRAAEGRYRALFDYAPDGILIANSESYYLDANPSMCRMLGYAREELIGLHASNIVSEAEISHIGEALKDIKTTSNHNREWQFRRKDGSTFRAEVIATQMPDGNLVGMVRDITERKQAQEQIAEQAAFLDKARDAILARDLEGKILFWNNGAERMYGWSRQEVMGQNVGGLLYADPKTFKEINQQTTEKGEWSGELHHLTKDRGEIIIEARWTLIRDNEGRPKSVLAINTDVTEKKKIETQFMRAQRMESIGTLAGGIAHDLNNILAPIMMSIDILKLTAQEPQAKGILETIEVSAKRGADIVRQVLSFARGLEGQRIEVQPKHLLKDLENIIKDTFPKDIRLQFSVPNDIWTILGDPTQIHQILLNLCINARDAMPNGGRLAVGVENIVLDEHYAAMNLQAKPGRYVNISVTDSGTGMPPELIDKIFEPFFTTKELNKGTGLGLSTVMAIVKSHEGIINVYSEPGKGTIFKVYLPAMETSAEGRKEQSEAADLPRGKGETILVVDDEASILTITGQTLQAFGYRVLTATDGADAVAKYAQNRDEIAVVLTDMMMPVMDGPATIHALMRINPEVKIVAASGLNTNGGVAKATGIGVKHFLTKPYTAGTLLKMMRTILDEPKAA